MNRLFLAASLALLPLAFACQPEFDASSEAPSTARSAEGTLTLEKKSGTSSDADRNALSSGEQGVMGLTGVPFASMEGVETARYEDPWNVHVETAYYVTFWADRARTIPVNLGAAIQLNYVSTYSDYKYYTSMRTNLSTYLQSGGHSYYIGSGTYECDYDANGNIDHRCDETWLSLRSGVGYDASY